MLEHSVQFHFHIDSIFLLNRKLPLPRVVLTFLETTICVMIHLDIIVSSTRRNRLKLAVLACLGLGLFLLHLPFELCSIFDRVDLEIISDDISDCSQRLIEKLTYLCERLGVICRTEYPS